MKNYILPILAVALLIVSCNKSDNTPPPPKLTADGLPVVFHILYEDPTDIIQNPSKTLIDLRLEQLNKYYSATMFPDAGSTPINIKFGAALYDPFGKPLAEPGIHRVFYKGSNKGITSDDFLNAKHPAGSLNAQVFWDPHKYINIWIFGFEDTEDVTGRAYLGFTTSLHPMNGSISADNYLWDSPDFMYGMALNTKYFHTESDGISTLVHEMGHLFGLYHAFSESNGCDNTDDASDDFCSDTPKYDRIAYIDYLDKVINQPATAENSTHSSAMTSRMPTPQLPFATKQIDLNELQYRTSCSGVKFLSVNIMDYFLTTEQVFTPQQRDRIEHILKYGPLVPRADNSKAFKGFEGLEITDEIPIAVIMQ